MIALTPEEQQIVERIQATVGPCPVLLCGSRALGTEVEGSDYDVVVVMQVARIPLAVRRLGMIARRLEEEIGTPVTVNPLPAHRLTRQGNLFSWKLRSESRVLSAPTGFAIAAAGRPPITDATAFSYLASGALYLLAALRLGALAEPHLSPSLQRAAHKCLLHVVQLRLLQRGQYTVGLGDAIEALDDERLRFLAVATGVQEGVLGIRDALLTDLEPLLARRPSGALVPNARYAVLAALRGRLRLRSALTSEPIDRALARSATSLLRAVGSNGTFDQERTAHAAAALPAGIRPRPAAWEAIRDTVLAEWPDAHPLGAI